MSAKVLIAAAGTGGHVFPALACAHAFAVRGYQVHWLASARGMEHELVTAAGFILHPIAAQGLRGKGLKAFLQAPVQLVHALWQASRVVRRLRPICALGMGGYVSGPACLAAWLSGVPVVIHEQNAVAGTANRILAHLARKICQGFPGAFAPSQRLVTTGNPVRPELFAYNKQPLPQPSKLRLLVLGGSLGAEPLNRLIPAALHELTTEERPQVVHQAGKAHAATTRERYAALGIHAQVLPFIARMDEAYAQADLVICRSGALTVSELAAVGLPALLIPLPHAIDDHQTHNAGFLVAADAALLLPQSTTSPQVLAQQLKQLCAQPERLTAMGLRARALAKPGATEQVVDLCLEVAHG